MTQAQSAFMSNFLAIFGDVNLLILPSWFKPSCLPYQDELDWYHFKKTVSIINVSIISPALNLHFFFVKWLYQSCFWWLFSGFRVHKGLSNSCTTLYPDYTKSKSLWLYTRINTVWFEKCCLKITYLNAKIP